MNSIAVAHCEDFLIGGVTATSPTKQNRNLPCEDAMRLGAVGNNAYCIAADGVSSASHSIEGVGLLVNTVVGAITRDWDWRRKPSRYVTALVQEAMTEANFQLACHAEDRGLPAHAYASTLQIALLSDDHLVYARIGDGGAVALLSSGAQWLGLPPGHGNVTGSITDQSWHRHCLQLALPRAEIDGFALFSDGAQNCFELIGDDGSAKASRAPFDFLSGSIQAGPDGLHHFPGELSRIASHDKLANDDRTIILALRKPVRTIKPPAEARHDNADDHQPPPASATASSDGRASDEGCSGAGCSPGCAAATAGVSEQPEGVYRRTDRKGAGFLRKLRSALCLAPL